MVEVISLQMALGFVNSQEALSFMDEVPETLAQPPWSYDETLQSGKKVNGISLYSDNFPKGCPFVLGHEARTIRYQYINRLFLYLVLYCQTSD